MRSFNPKELERLQKRTNTSKNGQVTIIGGSDLFHGAPILALKAASRIVDMVFFSSPEPSVGKVAEQLKSQLSSFIWIPWEEVSAYIKKSDAVLIGPGMKRWRREKDRKLATRAKVFDEEGQESREVTRVFLKKFPKKLWVIDGGALQVMDPRWIPQKAILTPNTKEFKMLFGNLDCYEAARKYNCIIVQKGPTTTVCSPKVCVRVNGGNPGLTKGGTGDVQAGLTLALVAKNTSLLVAAAASWITKAAADELYKRVGTVYNADDLAEEIPRILGKYLR